MNLENIQERISDIQNLRFISSQNEAAVSEKKQGNTIYKTEETKEGAETSFRMRFFIFGVWNDSSEAGFPLAPARYVPAPFTLKLITLSASGQRFPSLSSTLTVTNDKSFPSALICVRSGVSSI